GLIGLHKAGVLADDVPGSEDRGEDDQLRLPTHRHYEEPGAHKRRNSPGVEIPPLRELLPIEVGPGECLENVRLVEERGEDEVGDEDIIATEHKTEVVGYPVEAIEGECEERAEDEEGEVVPGAHDPAESAAFGVVFAKNRGPGGVNDRGFRFGSDRHLIDLLAAGSTSD